jgi:6-oxo-cyclohex-1-ene-carbonyl-CoA hydrolase
MALDWVPRAPKNEILNHRTTSDERLQRTEPPRTTYELKPIVDPQGNKVDGLYIAWITLDNPAQYNSYTLDMLAATAVAFDKASHDPSVVCVVFTGAGDRAFCTGGNVPEYAEHYVMRPMDCQEYMRSSARFVTCVLPLIRLALVRWGHSTARPLWAAPASSSRWR